ncbi:MAG TPA: FAD-binding and (Fe-S)-binding domain-containing protein [Rectinemataceae bacterium]|nr:FAD-binding and (Fe-S)-binding domain-containing protein [Rectinemataceae bacterium]
MTSIVDRRDLESLPPAYRQYYSEIAKFIPSTRIFCDPLRTFAYGTDASFYRLIPKIVVKARSVEEISGLFRESERFGVPLTFRAAGTSLSGQAVTDSVLVLLAGGWKRHRILDEGRRISLEPGVVGARANALLAGAGRKIGPDPASIDHCMIGGIAANNASGMCCGTAENSYRTVESMRLVFRDGAVLDTADEGSREAFRATHAELLAELEAIRDEIRKDAALAARIREKYRIKNTTGYGINSFIDFDDPLDILLHLMIGSEGSLGFIAEVTYRTVEEHAHKASALVIFPDIAQASAATTALRSEPVSAVELMDRASLRSVEGKPGMPEILASLGPTATALLVETRAGDKAALARQIGRIEGALASLSTVGPIAFTDRKEEYGRFWDLRKGLFPAVGAVRRVGTTVVIEDVVFPLARLAEATTELERLMREHGYDEGIIFGHALEGNLHFVFTQDFGDPGEVARYKAFMDAVCDIVVNKYDGSLKGEHGTGRNMAPFVELEWGRKAYALMRRIKVAFDPKGLINPGVVVGDDPEAHLRNLKALPPVDDLVDTCIECGFCEGMCPSKDLTLTPRQRISAAREMARLRAALRDGDAGGAGIATRGETAARLARFEKDYVYLGEATCATDGLCALSCPVSIDTGRYTKKLRAAAAGESAKVTARFIGGHFPATTAGLRTGLAALGLARGLIGPKALGSAARFARRISADRLPAWNEAMPGRSSPIRPAKGHAERRQASPPAGPTSMKAAAVVASAGSAPLKVVYFPSCIVRSMGSSPGDPDRRSLHEAMLSLLEKGGYEVILPEGLPSLCCGMAFSSKGFVEEGERKRVELESALLAASRNGEYPVLFDTSPCLYTAKAKADPRLRTFEPVEFIQTFLLDRLAIEKTPETIAIHITCSSRKMALAETFLAVARAFADKVVVPASVGCCGVAGDRIFLHPELSASALSSLKEELPPDCRTGYSNSRTCEIGVTLSSGIPYQSIVYLADRCSRKA